jgi:hypothetical protein
MKKQISKLSIITALLWATAIIAAAIVKAPTFFTVMLLPLLAVSSLAAIQATGPRFNAKPELYS